MIKVLTALKRPKMLIMAALGFSSGLPFLLIGNSLGYWLREDGISLTLIGFASWVGLTYSLKWLWAPLIDRWHLPVLRRLGHRRSWMLLSQILIFFGLCAMGLCGFFLKTQANISLLIIIALVVAFSSATQDIVIDAFRIEIAEDKDEIGLLTSAYSLGYRISLLITEALLLILAEAIGWSFSYIIMGLLVGIGITASLAAKEPVTAIITDPSNMTKMGGTGNRSVFISVIEAIKMPIITFFQSYGYQALAIFLLITFYHLPDYLRGPISNPFYKDLGLSKTTVGVTRATIGLWASVIGVSFAGLSVAKIGRMKTLLCGAVIQPLAILAFASLSFTGSDALLFRLVMGFDAFAMSFAGVALISYISGLTKAGYTATQYALLTSIAALAGKVFKGFSGLVLDHLQGQGGLILAYKHFYLGAALLGLPAIGLCVFLDPCLSKNKGLWPFKKAMNKDKAP